MFIYWNYHSINEHPGPGVREGEGQSPYRQDGGDGLCWQHHADWSFAVRLPL